MSNDLKIKKPKDLSKVDVNDLGELIWWSTHLGVCPEKLISIIKRTGNSTAAIKLLLNQAVPAR